MPSEFQPMRICILGNAQGVHVRRIASGLARRGHQVRVVSHKLCQIRRVEVQRFCVPRWGFRYPGRWYGRRAAYLRKLMRDHDVVHVHFLHDWGLTPEIAATGRLVVTPYGSDLVKPPDLDRYPDGVESMRRALLRMADAITAFGRDFARTTANFAGLAREDVDVVPFGVDLWQFAPSPDVSKRPPTVGFLKGFKAVYGPEFWVWAIPLVLARCPDARFEMVGDGPIRDRCRRVAGSFGLDECIRWLDPVPHDEVPNRLAGWDLSVVPSVCESFGVAALESAAMEIPVVASRVGGLLETVRDGCTGLLVEPENPKALADAVVTLLRDPARRRAMGAAGRAMVAEQYDADRCLDRMVEVYRRVCGRRRSWSVRFDAAVSGARVGGGSSPPSAPQWVE
jgi:glycosyltransferase involved in cell wall biosynthesis